MDKVVDQEKYKYYQIGTEVPRYFIVRGRRLCKVLRKKLFQNITLTFLKDDECLSSYCLFWIWLVRCFLFFILWAVFCPWEWQYFISYFFKFLNNNLPKNTQKLFDIPRCNILLFLLLFNFGPLSHAFLVLLSTRLVTTLIEKTN